MGWKAGRKRIGSRATGRQNGDQDAQLVDDGSCQVLDQLLPLGSEPLVRNLLSVRSKKALVLVPRSAENYSRLEPRLEVP